MRFPPEPRSRDRLASPDELVLAVPALSLDVTHWITITENKTINSPRFRNKAAEKEHI